MLKTENKELIYSFKKYKVTKEEIASDPSGYIIIVHPTMKFDISRIPELHDGNFIWSLWEGNLAKNPAADFISFLAGRNFTLHKVHTSGHADIQTLKQMADAINPEYIVPIHTFHGSDYKNIFSQPVRELRDGEEIGV